MKTLTRSKKMKIDTSSYKWWRNREPSGIDYYAFEVHYENGKRAQTYLFHGDYKEGLERVKEMYKGITEILVSI